MTATAQQDVRGKRRAARQGTASLRARLRVGTALAGMAIPLGLPGLALSADECGAPIGGVVTCNAAGSPYAGGILYNVGAQDLTLTLSADAEVRKITMGTGAVDIYAAGDNLLINLEGRVIAEGAGGMGVRVDSDAATATVKVNSIVSGSAGLHVFSSFGSAFINVGSIESATTGLNALNYDGPITIDAHSISTTDNNALGIDAYSAATGTLTINSNGLISTRGDSSTGILASTSGSVFIDVNAVATQGQSSNGITAAIDGTGLIDIKAASVSTKGVDSHAVSAEANSAGGRVAINVASATTQGDGSSGVQAKTRDGSIDITSGGVSTAGNTATAVKATSDTGAITINNTGVISTQGTASHGVTGYSAGGSVSVTNSGSVTTAGDGSIGLSAESIDKNVSINNSGSVATAGDNAQAVYAASDKGDVTVTNSGAVSATGERLAGLYATSTSGNVTVISTGSANASGDSSNGVYGVSVGGNVFLDVASASGAGFRSRAVSGYSSTGDVTAKIGSASTTGEAYVIDLRSQYGNLSLLAGDLDSRGDGAYGVFAGSDSGRIDLKVNSITTKGEDALGIEASSLTGPIAIDVSGQITTSGEGADGISASSDTGTVTIDARGAITTSAKDGDGVNVSSGGDVTIRTAVINTAGSGSDGILAETDMGKLTVVTKGTITTTGDRSEGIDVSSGSGAIDVTAGSLVTKGEGSTGIEAESVAGAVHIASSGTIETEGQNSLGVEAFGAAGSSVEVNSVSTAGNNATAILATADTGDVSVKAIDVRASGALSDGIVARSNRGSVNVTARDSSSATGAAIRATSTTGITTVAVAGTVRSTGSDAIVVEGGAGANITIAANSQVTGASSAIVASGANVAITNFGALNAGAAPTIIATQGPVSLANIGTFAGAVRFGAGDDLVTNSGQFALSGISDFAGGTDRFVNAGVVSLLSNATLSGLERFENAGLVTLANNRAGDVLALSGDYVGTNGRLALDIDGTSGSMVYDQLVVGGAASGTTSIALNYLGGGALMPGNMLKLVDAAGGSAADAFTLAPETANVGFSRYGLRYDAVGDDFFIVATEGTALFQTLKINEGAQALWRQSADAWSAHVAGLRDPARDASTSERIWVQVYGVTDARDQAFVSGSEGTTQNVDLSYRQQHAGGQFGVDLGAIGNTGVTYGLTGGYIDSTLKFAGTADSTDYQGFNLGTYAGGQWGNYFVNALAKYDLYRVKIDSVTAGYADTLDGHAYGLQVEAGARFGDADLFIEPVVGLAYTRTDLDTIEALGAAVDFDTLDGLRAKVGARVGGAAPVADGLATFYLGAHLVNEFAGDDGVRLNAGGSSTALVNDPVGAYGQFQMGVSLVSQTGLAGFIEGTADTSSDYQNYGGRIGVRMAF